MLGYDPTCDASAQITKYIASRADGVIDSIHCEETSRGLLVFVRADTESRLVVSELGIASADDCSLSEVKSYSLEDLLALPLPPRVPIVEGLIHESETVIIGGRPKVGKTRIVHQLGLSLVSVLPFLGMSVPARRRVLLIDLENGLYGIRDRLSRMTAGVAPTGLHVAASDTLADPKLTFTSAGMDFLKRQLERTLADVLIVDPWRLWLGGDENNAEQVVNGLKALSELRREQPKLAIVIVHHVRKENADSPKKLLEDPRLWADNLSGHHALISHAHGAFGLERRTENDEEMIVFGGISRSAEPKTLILEEDTSTLRFDVCRNEEAALKVMTPVERTLWRQARGLEQFRFSDLEQKSGSTNKKAISGMLKKAQEHGVVIKTANTYVVQS